MSRKILDDLGVSAFCESMAMMAQSGIQTDEALSLLQTSHESASGPLETALSGMRERVDEGESLSAAMEKSGVFPDYAVKMIRTGEDSGHLENILFRLSRYYADRKTIGDKLKNAVTYPAAMLILIILVLAAMLALVLPSLPRCSGRDSCRPRTRLPQSGCTSRSRDSVLPASSAWIFRFPGRDCG